MQIRHVIVKNNMWLSRIHLKRNLLTYKIIIILPDFDVTCLCILYIPVASQIFADIENETSFLWQYTVILVVVNICIHSNIIIKI